MKVTEKFIPIQKSARFWTFGDENAPNLLVVLHGYGQLAEYFIKNFQSLADKNYFIVATEGTHRFYLNGTSGRIGASWMSRELRELDIAENNLYLEQVFQYFSNKRNFQYISLLGFSQGGATAARFFAQTSIHINKLILWSCVFPPDLEIKFEMNNFSNTEKYFVLGTKDEYFPDDIFIKTNLFYEKNGFKVLNYEGGHKIDFKLFSNIFIH